MCLRTDPQARFRYGGRLSSFSPGNDMNIAMWVLAGAVLGCIPVVLIYFLFVDRYVQGMSGALKG